MELDSTEGRRAFLKKMAMTAGALAAPTVVSFALRQSPVSAGNGLASNTRASNTSLRALTSNIRFGTPFDLIADVTATDGRSPRPTGRVSFEPDMAGGPQRVIVEPESYGSATLRSGTARLLVRNLPVGTHRIRAVYEGDTRFSSSSSMAQTVVVSKGDVHVSLRVRTAAGEEGYMLSLVRVVVTPTAGRGTPTGSIALNFNNAPSGQQLELTRGVATGNNIWIQPGTTVITAVYSGDAGFNGATSTGVTVRIPGTIPE